MDDRYRIRAASPADATTLSILERRCFSDPWSAEGFREVLATPVCFGLVAAMGKDLQGYFLARLVAGEGEVLNLAVDPDHRRRGVGRTLLEAGLRELQLRGGREVFLEVRESNAGARAMYLARGFRVVGARQRYYRQPVEDALVLHLPLPTSA
jgi:ribosomal-protein-alanine N-acetyltransferase